MMIDVNADFPGYDPNWWRKVNWWLMGIAPPAILASVLFSRFYPDAFHKLQWWLEYPAPYMIALVAAMYLIRAVRTSNPLYIILVALTISLTCREFHFTGTHRGIYVALIGIAVWVGVWHKRMHRPLRDFRHTSWLLATMAAYVLSQVIARRAFRFIPGEQAIHRSLEECAETIAHVMFIVTSLVGTWRRYGRRALARQKQQLSEAQNA